MGVKRLTYVQIALGFTLFLAHCNEPTYGSFIDVFSTDTYFSPVEKLYDSGVTEGCQQCPFRKFCPEDAIVRSKMAQFVVRARGETELLGGPQTYSDVPDTHPDFGWIERLAADGLAEPCGTDLFCPDAEMPRGPMAMLLTLAIGETATHSGPQAYPDVGPAHPYYDWIQHLAERSLTITCSPSTTYFCPDLAAPREQVAWYIANAFGLPAAPPTPDVHYFVQAGAASPGDGSPSAPYPSIQTAFTAAIQSGKRATVSIANGTYVEKVESQCGGVNCDTNPNPIVLEGCESPLRPDGAILQAPNGVDYPLRILNAHDLTFRFLTVQNGTGAGVYIGGASTGIVLDGMLIRNNTVAGILTDDSSSVTVSASEIRDQVENGNGERGQGILSRNSSTLTVTSTLIQANHTAGVEVNNSTATIQNSQILNTVMSFRNASGLPGVEFTGGTGFGLCVTNGSSATVTNNTVSGNDFTGALFSVSSGTVTGNTFQDNGFGDLSAAHGIADYNSGGVWAQHGCPGGGNPCKSLLIENNNFARNTNAHVLLESSTASILSNQMSDSRPLPSGAFGDGIRVQTDQVRADPITIQGNTVSQAWDYGIHVIYNDAVVRDNTVIGTIANPWNGSDTASGSGLIATFYANVTVDTAGAGGNLMEGSATYGLTCSGYSSVTASSVTVRQNAKGGVVLQDCPSFGLDQSTVEANTGSGLDMQSSTATVTRSTIRTTAPSATWPGFGVWVKGGSNLTFGGAGMGNTVTGNAQGGVIVYSGTAVVSYNTIETVQTGTGGDWDAYGDGLFANGNTSGSASYNTIRDNNKYGAHLLAVTGGFSLGAGNVYSGNLKGDVKIIPP